MMDDVSIGVVVDWLVTYAGSEKVVSEILHQFGNSELYAIIDFLSKEQHKLFYNVKTNTSFIQSLPRAKTMYQKYLPLMPLAVEQFDVSKHDVVISSSHAVAKGVITGPDQLHISYIHSPIRYAWDLQHQYLTEAGLNKGLKGFLSRVILHKLRMWDYRTSNGVDHFIANSKFIARRIKKVYGRNSDVIYPPVDIESFSLCENKDDYFLTASRLVPYKRIDLIVEAFSNMPNKKLIVIGDGPEMQKIKSKATVNIELLGYCSNVDMQNYMRKAKAFVFAAQEDFGITPVEAQACGTPVIAYARGGALETIRPLGVENPTGLFFERQSVDSIIKAVDLFEENKHKFDPHNCRKQASSFSVNRFRSEFEYYVRTKYKEFKDSKTIYY
ncbi:glycosyltransferase family 4 protein [Pluralibacter gergoviae]|nr:glycosyltransferase family 4 protein [Pluralibacter gergoviae]